MEKILIVDDNKYIRFSLSMLLEENNYDVIAIADGFKAVKEMKAKKPDLVILDKKLPGCDGIDILKELKQENKDLPVIMLTAYADRKTEEDAIKLGAVAFVSKPFDNLEIISIIKKALNSSPESSE